MLENEDREHFTVVLLDARNRVVGVNTVSIGTLTASLVHPREVFKPAILANAAAIIVAHNHPSGDPEPSNEDVAITQRLGEAGALLGIRLLDHLVLGADGAFVSLADREVIRWRPRLLHRSRFAILPPWPSGGIPMPEWSGVR
jgi:DNA repair protein RadC